MRHITPWIVAVVLASAAASTVCSRGEKAPAEEKEAAEKAEAALPFDPKDLRSERWVERYDPAKAFSGYTLDLYQRRIPILIDMNGAIVHWWPKVRATGRARLTPEGRLLVICTDKTAREYDWDGDEVWSYRDPEKRRFPHHDLTRLRNGNNLLAMRDAQAGADFLIEVDPKGTVVWQWDGNAIVEKNRDRLVSEKDPTHINSVFELPANPWHDAGDARFTPGHILVSARNLSLVFIIDRATREIVWQHGSGLDFQHEASMIEKGQPDAGRIVLFNNRFHATDRRSEVLEIDPVKGAIVRKLQPPYLYSSVGATVAALPNGNRLITSSIGGRSFELDPQENVVWQFVPSYAPMRLHRYAYDYAKPFAGLRRAKLEAVAPGLPGGVVDRGLYKLGVKKNLVERKIAGEKRMVFGQKRLEEKGCLDLVVPPRGLLRLGYGPEAEKPAHFRVTLKRPLDADVSILDEEVSSGWQEKKIDLSAHAYRAAQICLDASEGGLWELPRVKSAAAIVDPVEFDEAKGASAEEREHLKEQMKAMGYVE